MKRIILAFATLVLVASVAGAQAKTTIKYAFWGNPDAIGVEKDIIEEFEALNPSIAVEPVVSAYGDYHTKLLTMIAGGAAPDVMRVDSYYFNDFMKVGALRSIADLVAKDKLDLSSYYQQGIQECTYDGALYGLPLLQEVSVVKALERLTGGQGEAELPVEDDDQRLGQLAQRRRSGLVGAREHRVCLEALVCGQRRWHA